MVLWHEDGGFAIRQNPMVLGAHHVIHRFMALGLGDRYSLVWQIIASAHERWCEVDLSSNLYQKVKVMQYDSGFCKASC
jgi:hypothetical protein